MPLYEYECTSCRRHTEKIQKFSDPEITTCPHCGGELRRVLSAPAIAFKGGGWFKDGYGNAPPPAAAKSEGGTASEAKSGESSAAPSDGGTKPAGDGGGSATAAAAPAPATAAPASAPAKT